MKNLWKIMAAMLVIALPFVVASCGDDDEEDVIPTYTYSWEITGIDLNKFSDEEQVTIITARNNVNTLIGNAYTAAGYTVDTANKKFSIQTEKAVKDVDENVQLTFLTLKQVEAFKDVASILPEKAALTVKRGNTIVVNNTTLYNK